MVTFPMTAVPRELKMFQRNASVRTGFAEMVGPESSIQCIISLVSLKRTSDGNFHSHQCLERQPMPCKSRTNGFNANLTGAFYFSGGCAVEIQLKGK